MRPSILFVDDEQSILDALSAVLRRQRKVWDMQFVCGGAAALKLLETARFDAIVTDMRMPGIDGEALLNSARKLCPGTVRVLLSGQSDPSAALRAVRVAHRFLSKPCSASELREVLEKLLFAVQAMDARTRELVCSFDHLPISSAMLARVGPLFENATLDPGPLRECIETHPPLAAQLLHLASAGFFASPQPVPGISHALRVLGLDTVRALILSMKVRDETEHEKRSFKHLSDAGRLLARISSHESARLAGLLHGLGVLVRLEQQTAEYTQLLDVAHGDPQRTLGELEDERFGIRHPALAAHLLTLWGAAPELIDAIGSFEERSPSIEESELARSLGVACALTSRSASAKLEPAPGDRELQLDDWRRWAAEISAEA